MMIHDNNGTAADFLENALTFARKTAEVHKATPCTELVGNVQNDLSPSSRGVRQYYCRFGVFSEDVFFV